MDHQGLGEADVFTRSRPGPERELLSGESGDERRVRVLARLEARVEGEAAVISEQMVKDQRFVGLSLVGVVASLDGRDGLFAQCGWFDDDEIDWFWCEITDVRSIEYRRDPRFRGGAPCLWLTTGFAEYAMTTSHEMYDEDWELTLEHSGTPRCDEWPRRGVRPDWWPVRWASAWPHDSSIRERYAALVDADPLAMLAQNLSLQSRSSPTAWLRLGPKGDTQLPGRPPNHLSQMCEWPLAPDAGLRKTVRAAAGSNEAGNEAGPSSNANGKRTRPAHERVPKRGMQAKRR
ncbi:hypothetical protein FRC10_009029 [Ceratobasidium sp. 414]|nr:hypothetical protein FRC10_009029 [Ceratobasidium sp. 414]